MDPTADSHRASSPGNRPMHLARHFSLKSFGIVAMDWVASKRLYRRYGSAASWRKRDFRKATPWA